MSKCGPSTDSYGTPRSFMKGSDLQIFTFVTYSMFLKYLLIHFNAILLLPLLLGHL